MAIEWGDGDGDGDAESPPRTWQATQGAARGKEGEARQGKAHAAD